MLDPGTPDCYMEPNGSQVESSSLETEDLSFEGAHLQANGKPDLSFGEWNSFGEGIQLDVSDYWSISAASTPPECLQVEEYDGANQQSSWSIRKDGTPAALDPEEGDMESLDPNSTLTLIQTKLLPPPQCRDGPGFIYQISHQWFSQYSLRLQGQESRKGFFL